MGSDLPSNGSKSTTLPLNDWNELEVVHAADTWGMKFPQYTQDMFDFVIENGKSYLDLGCGFGRFLHYLLERNDEPNYIGYDSSDAMILRLRDSFPEFSHCTFQRNITAEIRHFQESVLVSAVFIHITRESQQKILENLLKAHPKPLAITFDINSPNEFTIDRLKIKQSDAQEKYIKTSEQGTSRFRMTWQAHHTMTSYLLRNFKDYNLTTKFYDLHSNQHKVVYFLKRK